MFVVGNFFFASPVQAEVQTYTGVGEYLMSDFETFDIAQQRAKQRAEQNACEQAGVYVESRTEVKNAQVTNDEIVTMTRGILQIIDVQFKREFVDDNTTRIRATIKAQIDSDDVTKWLAKYTQERAALVAPNNALRQFIAKKDKQISTLKHQPADSDKKFLPNRTAQSVFANIPEVERSVGFTPLNISQEQSFLITGIAVNQNIVEIRHAHKSNPKVSLTVQTYKRTAGEKLQDISGVTGVRWSIKRSNGTKLYIAKISETQQGARWTVGRYVAVWAVGQYTFSALGENFTYGGFYSMVVDKLIPLSNHY